MGSRDKEASRKHRDKSRSSRDRERDRSGSRSSRRKRRHESPSESEDDSGSDGSRSPSPKKVDDENLRAYLAKKAQRKALKLAKKLKQNAVSGYTNDSNPFGDANLTEKFVWRKKIEKDVLSGALDVKDLTMKAEKQRQVERMVEVEKVKKRREERELEKIQHEEEMNMLARERARAEFIDWERKEEEFHFDQSKVRSRIRLQEGRAKPIDLLAKNLLINDDFDLEINEPYKIFKGLTVKEMEDLREDIRVYQVSDRENEMHIEFWEALMVVCEHEVAEATKRDILDRAKVRGEEPPPELTAAEVGLHASVDTDVQAMLGGKSSQELVQLEAQIKEGMEQGTAKVVEYWESVLKRLKVYKAKAKLKELHASLLQRHLARLQDPGGQQAPSKNGERAEDGNKAQLSEWEDEEEAANAGQEAPESYSPQLLSAEEAAKAAPEGEPGSFSPELLQEYDKKEEIVDPDADKAELERRREQVMEEQQKRLQEAAAASASARRDDAALSTEEKAAAVKAMGADPGDAVLGAGAEVNLESQVYWWHDKYRPRKPKYFNRVHTGYEWNKYNQTHYDHDNPPPKIVQGYKFNIFYPDLIHKTKAPEYVIEKDEGNKNGETCIIRFHAGPPYEDIAFRIVNKEWEYSHKKGFKSTFDRGILHVYFNFKRHRYRR